MHLDLDLTEQQIFDKVVSHLREQGGKAAIVKMVDNKENFVCQYRTPEGRKCGVGCVIPDDLYLPEMEGRRVGQLTMSTKLGMDEDLRNLFRHNLPLLRDIQSLHDTTAVEVWERQFQWVASKYFLLLDGQVQRLNPEDNPYLSMYEKAVLREKFMSKKMDSPIYPDASPGEL